MHITETPVALTGATDQQIQAIENEARKRGVSVDDAMKQMLLEHADQLITDRRFGGIGRLLRFPLARKK